MKVNWPTARTCIFACAWDIETPLKQKWDNIQSCCASKNFYSLFPVLFASVLMINYPYCAAWISRLVSLLYVTVRATGPAAHCATVRCTLFAAPLFALQAGGTVQADRAPGQHKYKHKSEHFLHTGWKRDSALVLIAHFTCITKLAAAGGM